jgi:hypothetical protein
LLDQGFPKPHLPAHEVDRSIEYEHLSDWYPELAEVTTPDWLVYLHAHHAARFRGIVTRDRSQVAQQLELIALQRTDLAIVTWRKGLDDPVTEWALVIAYMPLVRRHLAEHGPGIIYLPEPRLRKDMFETAHDLAHAMASEQRIAYQEFRQQAMEFIHEELTHRELDELWPYVE